MSFTTTFAVLPHTTLDELGVVDPSPLDFDTVTSFGAEGLTGTQVGPHVLAVDPLLGELVVPAAAALGRQVHVVMLGGVSDTYVLQSHGPLTRLRVHQSGELVEDRGDRLPAEAALDGADDLEDAFLDLVAALMEAPLSSLWEGSFVTLAATPGDAHL